MGDIRSIIPYGPRFGTDRVRALAALAAASVLLAACSSSGVNDVAASLTASPPPATSAAAPPEATQDPSIAIETPLDHREVGNPVSVTGTADVVGNEVTVRVLDAGGSELAAANVEVDCQEQCPGTFGAKLFYVVDEREPGWIEVSGEAQHGRAVSTVPVVLFPP